MRVAEALSYCTMAEQALLKATVRYLKEPTDLNRLALDDLAATYEERDLTAEQAVAEWNNTRQELGLRVVSNRALALAETFPDYLEHEERGTSDPAG